MTPALKNVPRHIAVIMDGNGRWARERGLPRIKGHEEGGKSVREIIEGCVEMKVEYLTLYAFSAENWKRPKTEVLALMRLLERFLEEKTPEMMEKNVRLQAIGRLTELPQACQAALHRTIEATSKNSALTLILALSYSARLEIVDAVKSILREIELGHIDKAMIDDSMFSKHLYTRYYPDPDLLIRTSGEMRLSNFLLWQLSYTEMYVTPKLWPDFRKPDLIEALRDYGTGSGATAAFDSGEFRATLAAGNKPLEGRNKPVGEHIQTILIVDPETDFAEWAANQLQTPTTRVLTATQSDEAFRMVCAEDPELVIAETHLMPFSGLDLLARVRQRNPNALVILTSAFGTTQSVIEAMKLGAFDYIRKEQLPFNMKVVVDAALSSHAEMRAATTFHPQLTLEQHQDSIVGQSPAMQQVFKMIGRVSHSNVPVMITGESGSGKELVARAIHHYSQRSTQSFLAINCAAIPDNLLESELFGHEKGAFTGAVNLRIGRFEQSNSGTLFLDEIGDMPVGVQGKILRVLQEGEFSRVGGTATLKTDVRVIAATNKNLEQEVAAKLFREDLFYRLNVVGIHLPPLRQRREDIRLLAEYFLQRIAITKHTPQLRLSEEAVRAMEAYSWPGNVRELQNTIERASVLATADVLLPKDIPLGATHDDAAGDTARPVSIEGAAQAPASVEAAIEFLLRAATSDPGVQLLPWLEREFTIFAMKRTRGNQVRAAKLLGVTRATLRKRIERYGITRELNIQ